MIARTDRPPNGLRYRVRHRGTPCSGMRATGPQPSSPPDTRPPKPKPQPPPPEGPPRPPKLATLRAWATAPAPYTTAVAGAATLLLGYAVLCTGIAAATVTPASTVGLAALLPLMAAVTLTHILIGAR